MKLYISDLDGTLLNANKEVSKFTKEALNFIISKGVNFSIATARTAASAIKILSGLNINVPVVLMNGAVIYDIKKNKYINMEEIPSLVAYKILSAFRNSGISGFMYTISGNNLVTYYENLNSPALKEFYDERVLNYYKTFEKVDNFANLVTHKKIVYFTLIDDYERLLEIYSVLESYTDIDAVLYKDIYAQNLWYLEIYSKKASKYNAVRFLREYCKFDSVIGFGDNFNDIPLFKACDRCYAVSNAVSELKESATAIIDDNLSDGVAKFILKEEGIFHLNT